MKDIILVGYSGHALVAADILQQTGFRIIGYFDKCKVSRNPLDIPYLGYEEDKKNLSQIECNVVFPAIGNNTIRQSIFEYLQAKGFCFSNAISPNAYVANTTEKGMGLLINHGAIINTNSVLGDAVIINTGAIVEHECLIGDFSHIAPGAVLAGNVTVGKKSFIGANAVVKEGVKIGDNVIVGAGSVVLKDVPSNNTIYGNPAK